MVHHEWVMIVTWLCIVFFDLCRWLFDDYVVSIIFFDLCLVDGVCWLVSQFWVHRDAGKCHVLWWSTRCDSFLEEQKTLLASFSVLYNLFSRLMVFLACDKMSQEVFAAIGELILLTPKSSKEGLDSQWEGWQSSKHRESSGSAAAREQWLKDIVSYSARHVKVFRWLSKRFWYNLKFDR